MALPPPPPTPREDVVDSLHGERIADPYRWLEDGAAPRVNTWSAAQNARTRSVLDGLPQRGPLARRLHEQLAVGLLSAPRPVAVRIFHTRREGEEKQAVLYVRDALEAPNRAPVDPKPLND